MRSPGSRGIAGGGTEDASLFESREDKRLSSGFDIGRGGNYGSPVIQNRGSPPHSNPFDNNVRAIFAMSSAAPRNAQSCDRSSTILIPVSPPMAGT